MAIAKVGVVGCGLMGSGIAEICAKAGLSTIVREVSDEFLKKGQERINGSLAKAMKRAIEKEKKDPTMAQMEMAQSIGRLSYTTRLEDLKDCDLIVEAIIEDKGQKQDLYKQLDALCKPSTIFCSNTSNISITELGAVTRRADKFAGLHFFNPVPVMKLLEIVVHDGTHPDVLAACRAFGAAIGKECITVRDFPGFATSRLGVCLGMEAIRMVEQGVASPEDIDTALVLGYRHPIGPLRLTDLVGLDVRLAIGEYLAGALGNPAFEPPALLRRMVAEGHLGKKSGQGFYRWDP